MQLVRRVPARARVAVLLAVLAVPAAGCNGDGEENDASGAARLGAPVRLANCRDWKAGSIRERQGTIEAIREFAGGEVPGRAAGGRTIPDDKAYDLFENYCKNDFARGFKLYKLYGRAAAFTSD